LPAARQAGVLGRLYSRLAASDALAALPKPVLPHLEAGFAVAAEHERMIRWEVNRIQRALQDTAIPLTLLKGAAYVMAKLPFAQGRLASDVDIMVAHSHLEAVEQALRSHGWAAVKLDPYDQRYYRHWMHELPPLRHVLRGAVVDVHHAILPATSRLKPNPAKLLAAARALGPGLNVLAPADMVLHSAAHALHDGDLRQGARDLLDLHDLLSYFGREPGFWEILPHRAIELNLERPLFYALRYVQRFFDSPIPAAAVQALAPVAPHWPTRLIMDGVVGHALQTGHTPTATLARRLLYLRAHWLRMPPLLLANHLLHKVHKRTAGRRISKANQTPG